MKCLKLLKVFQKELENQLGKTIKLIHSDRGGEYMSQEFLDHLKEHEIIAHRTPPYTPQHNGVSDRRNRTLLDMGCEALVKRDTLTKPDKLEPRSIKCIFVGYPKETVGYSFNYPPENKVIVARNVEFLENSLITQEASGSLEDLEIIQEEDTHPSINTSSHHKEGDLEIDEPQSDIIPIRMSTRTRHAPDRMCVYIDAKEHELGDLGKLANYKDVLLGHESDKWLIAMNVEMQSMKDNEVWDLVDLPPNGKTIGSKWLFKKKTDLDGTVHTYKARLVAKGFSQTYGFYYEETLSPVADIRAIRILIAIAAYYDYEIWLMDVKTAFLNGHISEKVYMEQPEGFVNPKYPNRVCKLKRSIYGLKQASRQWNKRFDDEIKKFGFTQNRDEPCVFLKASRSNVTFLILYVDDILIIGNNIPMLQDVKSYLGSAYIEKILKILHMENSKRRSIPMQEKLKLSKSQGASTPTELKRMHNVSSASAVGSIMYAVRCTRPDVVFTQNITSRFQYNLGDIKQELRVSCYTDAQYLTDADDLKSRTGYVFILNGGAVDWKSTKQSIFATSSAEDEYIASYDASKEAVWVRKFISGLVVVPTIKEPIEIYYDNTRAITIANESGINKGARHFRAKVHYLREVIEYGDIKLEKVHTDDNLADPFTKALAFRKHSEHIKNIGMLPASSLMRALLQDDCDLVSENQIKIKLRPHSEDPSYEDVDVSALLSIRFFDGYPYKCPKLQIKLEKELAKSDADNLLSLCSNGYTKSLLEPQPGRCPLNHATSHANSYAAEGRVMILKLVEAARKFLSEVAPHEPKYKAAYDASNEAVWISENPFYSLGVDPNNLRTYNDLCDNTKQ
ncbi:retrotransposon protein, putative, ty1-copia subclass [Tanacetum coccineum]